MHYLSTDLLFARCDIKVHHHFCHCQQQQHNQQQQPHHHYHHFMLCFKYTPVENVYDVSIPNFRCLPPLVGE
jgi:hypothetical protein